MVNDVVTDAVFVSRVESSGQTQRSESAKEMMDGVELRMLYVCGMERG